MNKVILKTIIITVCAFIGALCIAFGSMCLFAPGTVATVFENTGSYSASVFFMEKQYEKDGSLNSLCRLVKALDEYNDSNRTSKYGKILTDQRASEFEYYCETVGKIEFGEKKYCIEYFYTKYAVAEMLNENTAEAISVADECVSKCGYTATNPYKAFIYELNGKISKSKLESVKTSLVLLASAYTQYITEINKDVQTIEVILGE